MTAKILTLKRGHLTVQCYSWLVKGKYRYECKQAIMTVRIDLLFIRQLWTHLIFFFAPTHVPNIATSWLKLDAASLGMDNPLPRGTW